MNFKALHPVKLALYVALSLADLYLTYRLIQQSDGEVYETNPFAAAWFSNWGWTGMIIFKALTVLVVASTSTFVSLTRPRTGAFILGFACCMVAGVVIYSCSLSRTVSLQLEQEYPPSVDTAAYRVVRLRHSLWPSETERRLLEDLKGRLLAQECTLAEALDKLSRAENESGAAWVKTLQWRYPGRNDQECLAACLVEYTISSLRDNPSVARQVAAELDEHYTSSFGSSVPFKVSEILNPSPAE